jgi:DNA-binding IclR family transcriptional regulator
MRPPAGVEHTASGVRGGSLHPASGAVDERKFVTALARGLDLLRAFRPGEAMLGNRDFVVRTGLAKATVSRLAYTLTELGYLRYDRSSNKYALDAGVLALGFAFLSGSDVLELARPHLRALARDVGAAVSLGCRERLDMIYLETIRSETALTLGLASGSRLSILTSSMGRAYLAMLPEGEREALIAECAAALEGGDTRLIEPLDMPIAEAVAAARAAVDAFHVAGCCFSFRDWHDDVNAVAVPFRDPRQDRWLVLSCSGPASSMAESVFVEQIAPKLRALAARLGGR